MDKILTDLKTLIAEQELEETSPALIKKLKAISNRLAKAKTVVLVDETMENIKKLMCDEFVLSTLHNDFEVFCDDCGTLLGFLNCMKQDLEC